MICKCFVGFSSFAYLIKILFHMLSAACCFSDYIASVGRLLSGSIETAFQVMLQALDSLYSQAGGG